MVVHCSFVGGWTFLAMTWIIIHYLFGYHPSAQRRRGTKKYRPHIVDRFFFLRGRRREEGYRLFCRPLDSKAYHAAPAPTNVAPTFTPIGKGFPKTTTLNAKLVNLRIFKTIAIVTADEMAVNRFTPRTQRYCVTTLIRRK